MTFFYNLRTKNTVLFTICSKRLPVLFAVTFLSSISTNFTSARRVKRILSNFIKLQIMIRMMFFKDRYIILIPANIFIERTKLLLR